MDCNVCCMAAGLVVSGWYSTVSVALAKLTAASNTPGSALTVLSELTAHPAQVIFKTGNDSFTAVCLSCVAIALYLSFVINKVRHKGLMVSYTILGKSCKIYIILHLIQRFPLILFNFFKMAGRQAGNLLKLVAQIGYTGIAQLISDFA